MIKKIGIAVAVLFVLGIFFGGEDTTPAPAAPAPAPAPAPTPTPAPAPQPERTGPPMKYGDDPYLDDLWDLCAADDYDACDELFWESPLDSDYEDFALDRMYELEASDLSERDVIESVGVDEFLTIAWNTLSREDRRNICDAGATLGWDWAAGRIVEGTTPGMFTVPEVSSWLRRTC